MTRKTVSVIYVTNGSGNTKGQEIPLPSGSGTGAAGTGTQSASGSGKTATEAGVVASPYVYPSPKVNQTTDNVATSAANGAQSILSQIGSSLAKIAIMAGVALLILALLTIFLLRPRKENQNVPAPQKPLAPPTPAEDQIAARIRELQQKPAVTAPVRPVPVPPPAPVILPMKPPQVTVNVPPIVKPTIIVKQTPPAPVSVQTQTSTPKSVVTSPTPATPPTSTMMQKIKDKGLDQNIPQNVPPQK